MFPLTPFELTLLIVGIVLIAYASIGLAKYGKKR